MSDVDAETNRVIAFCLSPVIDDVVTGFGDLERNGRREAETCVSTDSDGRRPAGKKVAVVHAGNAELCSKVFLSGRIAGNQNTHETETKLRHQGRRESARQVEGRALVSRWPHGGGRAAARGRPAQRAERGSIRGVCLEETVTRKAVRVFAEDLVDLHIELVTVLNEYTGGFVIIGRSRAIRQRQAREDRARHRADAIG